jgi:hypothetical protein
MLAVELRHRGVALDLRVHERLGVARLVALVVTPAPVTDEVDDDVLLEALPVLVGEGGHVHHGLGVVAVHVQDGGLHHLGDVRAVGRAAGVLGQGREADLVVDHHVDGAARRVALQAREVQGLRHDPLAREGGVAVEEDGQDLRALLVVERVLPRAHHPLHHRVHPLEVARVRGHAHGQRLARVRVVGAGGPQVVLHVARALGGVRVRLSLELREDLGQGLADGVGQHVQAAAVGHADHGLPHALARGVGEHAVQERDGGLAALQREALVADVLRMQEALEALRLHHLLEDPAARGGVEGRPVPRGLHPDLQPLLALGVGDEHVLDADGAAVGVAQDLEHLPQGGPVLPGKAVGDELAVQVPQREAVGGRVQVAVGRALGVEGIEVGHEVAAHAVGVHQLEHAGLLLHRLVASRGAEEARRLVDLPAHGTVRDLQVLEDPLVEGVLALEQLLHAGQEQPRLRALDDPVVVGRGDGHDLADAQDGEGAGGHGPVLRGVVQGPRGHDQSLPGHEPWRGGGGPDGAGVGERHRGPQEVVGRDGALARAGHEVVEGLQEAREVERVGVLDVGDEEGARSVLALHVHRHAQADRVALDAVGRAVQLGVRVVEAREGLERPQDGPGHQVGEADLAPAGGVAVLVEEAPVLLEGADGDRADGGGGGDAEARLHVLHDAHGAAPDGGGDVAGEDDGDHEGLAGPVPDRRRARRDGILPRQRRGPGGCGRWAVVGQERHRAVVLVGSNAQHAVEVVAPARLHAAAVAAVLVEKVEREHVVRPEVVDQVVEKRIRGRFGHVTSLCPRHRQDQL